MKNHQNQNIYWDVDDVVLETSPTLVKLINEKYLIPNNLPEKTIYDIRDWNLKSIYHDLTNEQLDELFESDDFWNNVTIKLGFIQILESGVLNNYFNYFITVGTEKNLTRKEQFLKEHLGELYNNFYFIGVPYGVNKSDWEMYDSIQIDDNFENLIDTNARVKVLLTNNLETRYNNSFGDYDIIPDNLYRVNSLKEVYQLINFNLQYKL